MSGVKCPRPLRGVTPLVMSLGRLFCLWFDQFYFLFVCVRLSVFACIPSCFFLFLLCILFLLYLNILLILSVCPCTWTDACGFNLIIILLIKILSAYCLKSNLSSSSSSTPLSLSLSLSYVCFSFFSFVWGWRGEWLPISLTTIHPTCSFAEHCSANIIQLRFYYGHFPLAVLLPI